MKSDAENLELLNSFYELQTTKQFFYEEIFYDFKNARARAPRGRYANVLEKDLIPTQTRQIGGGSPLSRGEARVTDEWELWM